MAIFEQIIHLSDHIATHVVVGFSCSTNSISLPWMYHYNVFAVAVVKVVSKCVNCIVLTMSHHSRGNSMYIMYLFLFFLIN